MMLAVDVSRWQGTLTSARIASWRAAGVGLVIVKCGGGDDGIYEDPRHEANVTAVHAAGLPADRYWFNGYEAVSSQAVACWEYVSGTLQRGERVWADVEPEGVMPAWSDADVVQFARALPLPVARVGLYVSASRVPQYPRSHDAGLSLWVASYGNDDGTDHGVPDVSPWRRASMLQYTSRGSLPGFAHDIDLDDGMIPYIVPDPPHKTPTLTPTIEEDDMTFNSGFYADYNIDGKTERRYLVCNTVSGFQYQTSNGIGNGPLPTAYVNGIATAFHTVGNWALITSAGMDALVDSLKQINGSNKTVVQTTTPAV